MNRYAAAGDNREDRRHKEARGTTIGYDTVPTPDEITLITHGSFAVSDGVLGAFTE